MENRSFYTLGAIGLLAVWFVVITQATYIIHHFDHCANGFKTLPLISIGYVTMVALVAVVTVAFTIYYTRELLFDLRKIKDDNKFGKLV